MKVVESYKRARLLDLATSDDDKVTPVYRLDEIADMMQAAGSDMVKVMVDYLVKRLEYKSPYVKHKVLRLFKYCVVKAGKDFRREVQRHSGAIRSLFNYKGQPDPLKGDALNKAVRDLAHEAISAIFSQDDNRSSASESTGRRRMEGFGSSDNRTHDDRSHAATGASTATLSDFIEYGSAQLKQGLSRLGSNVNAAQEQSAGTYRGPSLTRSLTSEHISYEDKQGFDEYEEVAHSTRTSQEAQKYGGRWSFRPSSDDQVDSLANQDADADRGAQLFPQRRGADEGKPASAGNSSSASEKSTHHAAVDRLVDSITAPGGVRVQPSRDALNSFLASASSLDGHLLTRALEVKLKSHIWQVRLKALCALEAAMRQDGSRLSEAVFEHFEEDAGSIIDCLESPQASVRERAKRVLELLGFGPEEGELEEPAPASGSQRPAVVDVPDLFDTSDGDLLDGLDEKDSHLSTGTGGAPGHEMATDLLGEALWTNHQPTADPSSAADTTSSLAAEDLLAGVSSQPSPSGDSGTGDIFSGLEMGNDHKGNTLAATSGDLFDGLELGVPGASTSAQAADSLASLMANIPTSSASATANGPNPALLSSAPGVLQGSSQQVPLRPPFGEAASPQAAPGLVMPGLGSDDALQRQLLQQQQQLLQQQMLYMQALGMGLHPMSRPGAFPHGMLPTAAAGFGMANGLQFVQLQQQQQLQQLPLPLRQGQDLSGLQQLAASSPLGPGDFDFSGDPTLRRSPSLERRKDETHAFDFVMVLSSAML
eukprot:SM000132S26917  [mRNA]  locus=s132:381927:385196:- [translate_table: standard]